MRYQIVTLSLVAYSFMHPAISGNPRISVARVRYIESGPARYIQQHQVLCSVLLWCQAPTCIAELKKQFRELQQNVLQKESEATLVYGSMLRHL